MSAIDIDWKPDTKKLKEFGWVSAIGFPAIGFLVIPTIAWLHKRRGEAEYSWLEFNWNISLILLGVGLGIWLLSLISAKAVRPIYLLWMGIAFPIGFIVSHILLGGLYFLLFTPMALVFKLIGRDALDRKIDKGAESYWTHREGRPENSRYIRGF